MYEISIIEYNILNIKYIQTKYQQEFIGRERNAYLVDRIERVYSGREITIKRV